MIPSPKHPLTPLAIAALLALACSTVEAQQPAPRDSLPAYLLEGVTVTARRAPAPRSELPQQVDVVTRAALDRTVAGNATEALKKNVALDVIEFPGLLSGVSVRGFRPQFSGLTPRTLILLDGRPAGITNLSTLDVAVVERIEVLRGPASALYGSSAMGAVVNVVTRRSSGTLGGSARAGYGSFQSWRGELAVGGDLLPALDFDLAIASSGRGEGYTTGGKRTFGGGTVVKTLRAGGTLDLEELTGDTTLAFSEFASRSGSLRLGYALSDRWRVDARGGFFRGDDVQNPGDLNAPYDSRTVNDLDRYTGDVGVSGQLHRHALTLRAFGARERNSYYDDPDEPAFVSSRSPNSWHGAQLQDVISFGAHTLTAGLDYTAARARSEVFSAPETAAPPYAADSQIRSAAAFAETKLALLDRRLTATLGGRLDRVAFELEEAVLYDASRVSPNSETHTVFNPSAGLLYRAPAGVRLHASAGRAFVTPTAFNVAGYSERSAGERAVRVTRGNPQLRPESSLTWDAGAGILRPRLGVDADLTYFHTDVRDRISAQPVVLAGPQLTPGGDTIRALTSYVNSDEAEIRGLEASLGYDLGARVAYAYSLRLFASATRILRAEEITAAVGKPVLNVADLTAVFGVEYDDMDRFGARLSGRYVGERSDTDFSDWMNPGEVRYPRYLVVDLSTSVRVGDRYRLGAELANLTDENYYEVRGYNLPGRALRVNLGVSF